MNRFRILKRKNENNIIWKKVRLYIDFCILVCCLIVAFNIHPSNSIDNLITSETQRMLYIFHDYEWNEYILNDTIHWSADSRDYLFDDEVPDSIKWDNSNHIDSVSLANKWDNTEDNSWSVKDNQVSIENIMSDLWIDSNSGNDYLVIDLSDNKKDDDKTSYSVEKDDENNSLIIEKEGLQWDEITQNNENDETTQTAKTFSYITDGRVIPILVPRDELQINEYGKDSSNTNWYTIQWSNWTKTSWISIIDDYADCMTPRWYKIIHWDSVLAYKQLDNAPDICNIERRYCWNGKLSWTYTQQWCSVNKNYSYNLRWEAEESKESNKAQSQEEIKWWAKQNPDWTVSVKNDEIWWWFVFDRPNKTSSDFSYSEDNTRQESQWIEQTSRPYRDCTTPRWEKIKHGWFIQAFKHANWFSDAPCEAQFRLCTMWELLWTYTESTCKTRDSSFVDWINGSPTRETYSKEKLRLIKQKLKDEEKDYKNNRKNATKSTNSVTLDKILYILDMN